MKEYRFTIAIIAALGILFCVTVPATLWQVASWNALVLATIFGASVGAIEIANRYRDEPFRACGSPFGVLYVAVNGVISLAAALLIYHYRSSFPTIAPDPLGVSFAAGFGGAVVLRSKLATIQDSNKKDVSIGPDVVVQSALKLFDAQVDRYRAARRLQFVMGSLNEIRALGTFDDAASYLSASLLAFQNLDDQLRGALTLVVQSYQKEAALPSDLKYLGLGFVFLTIVGEAQYDEVLKSAKGIRMTPAPAPAPVPGPKPPPMGGAPTP